MKKAFIFIMVLIAAGAAAFSIPRESEPTAAEYRLARAERGDIVRTVSASGVAQAVVTVNVGAQISGMVSALAADFNSRVRRGEVIARIDPAPFEARLAQAMAEVDVARASLARQTAVVSEAEAEAEGRRAARGKAAADLERQRSLATRGSASAQSLEAAEAAFAEATADLAAAEARIESQRAQIDLARAQIAERAAALAQRRIELDQTEIRSPVDGVVINRNVDVGQIVAATLEAPVLFQIAQDLARMQLTVNIDEADIGRIAVGQIVDFTVDAHPNRRFAGRVSQVRLAGRALSNVVTYAVIVDFDNPDLLLLPGMTADASIVVARRDGALRVPTAAFYFTPPGVERGNDWKVWVPGPNSDPAPKTVEFGLYDDSFTEITGGLAEGDAVIVGMEPAPEADGFSWSDLGL